MDGKFLFMYSSHQLSNWSNHSEVVYIGVHYVKNFTHTQGVKLKHNGIEEWGIYGLDGMGHL